MLVAMLAAFPLAAQVQSGGPRESLKQSTLTAPPAPACASSTARPNAPTPEQRRAARQLAQRGQEASILGDSVGALGQLRQAATLDPTDPDLAYQLARAYETAGAGADAAKEYCRFLTLAPTAPEATEARERARILSPPRPDPTIVAATSAFNLGVNAYNNGQLVQAEVHFSTAIQNHSSWADAYYDRAIVRAATGDKDGAVDDYTRYLGLRPDAPDRAQILSRIDALRRPGLSPGQALSLGLVIPGGGQFYVRRPVRGVLSLVGFGAGLAAALQQKTSVVTIDTTFSGPFGTTYPGTVKHVRKERPYLVPGAAVAGGILLVSAFDAFAYSHSLKAGPRRVSVSIGPAAGALAARVSLR